MTGADLILRLWEDCRTTARIAGCGNAKAVQNLIAQSRELLRHYGCSDRDANVVLFTIYLMSHWDWPEPSARIFETLLEIELFDFFKERLGICNP
jgi:hypothetical protein